MLRSFNSWRVAILAGLAWTAAASAQAQTCDNACLRKMTDQYLTALTQRNANALPLTTNVKFTENGKRLQLNEGLWKAASGVGEFREFYADARTSNALFIGVVDESGSPAIVATRLKVDNGRIAEIENVVARKGSHPLFAPEALAKPDPLWSAKISEDTRVPRARMIEIADAYFDGIVNNSSAGIPAVPDCDRFENGVKTTFRTPTSGNCAKSADNLNYIKAVRDRRYFIVDETTGVVACTVVFDIPGGDPITTPANSSDAQLQTTLRQPRMLLLTELFKIDGGNLVRVQAVMHNLPHGAKSGWEK